MSTPRDPLGDFSNPFAAPGVSAPEVDPSGRPAHYGDATTGQRFVNLVIDYLCINVVSFMAGVIIAGVFGEVSGAWFVGMFAMYGYYAVLEALTGRTLGKLITGTRVVDERGEPPSIGAVLLRSIVRFVPFEAFSFLGNDSSGWHDRWSKTRVVRLRPNSFEANL